MDSDALEPALSRYRAAYTTYLERTQRVAEKLGKGSTPAVDEIMEEAKATEELAIARRELLEAIAKILPPTGRP